MLRSFRTTLLILAVGGAATFTMCCVPPSAVREQLVADRAETPLEMMASTVQVHVNVTYSTGTKDKNGKFEPSATKTDGWTGSGVVYGKDSRGSLILSANHVLETPKLGEVVEEEPDFLGMIFGMTQGPKRFKRADAVLMTITTFDGRSCELKPMALGSNDHRDTATALASCDAGRVAKIARASPARGEKVFVVGHPTGLNLAVVTEGYVAGMKDSYVYLSAPVAPGNSGGAVFHNGEVVGLLVRVNTQYHHISLMTPLEQVLQRIAETRP